MYQNFIGVDVGRSGAIAIISDSYQSTLLFKMPQTERDIWNLFSEEVPSGPDAIALIENVHAFPKDFASRAFKFGMSYGSLRMALIAHRTKFDEVNPATWMKAMGCLTKGDKKITKAKAQQLYPEVEGITLDTADALLIASYCQRKFSHGPDKKG